VTQRIRPGIGHVAFFRSVTEGCVVYSAVDATTEGNPVFFMDVGAKDIGAPMSSITIPHKASLQAWLDDWLQGKDLWKEVWG
jgi:hypothetical protein